MVLLVYILILYNCYSAVSVDQCGGKCHYNASCMTYWFSWPKYQCSCNSGFVGDGYTCSARCDPYHVTCHHHASCTYDDPSRLHKCTCNSGFKGDGYYTCTDIHICENPDTCGPNAICEYNAGRYKCQCKAGYVSNKITNFGCVDVNECQAKPNNRKNHDECQNTVGPNTCTCLAGYSNDLHGDPGGNECVNPFICGGNAECQNTIGSYECRCLAGYVGDPRVNCTDINECKNSNICGVNAECQNTIGSYECRCLAGYEGEPPNCTDINECVNQNSCAIRGADCVNQPGTYECVCPPGANTDSTGQCRESRNPIRMEVIVAIIGVTLAVVILVIYIIVSIHKRKRRQEQAENIDITYENLDNGRLPTPEPWKTYSTRVDTEGPTYSEPGEYQASAEAYAIPVPKRQRQVPNEYVEAGELAQPDYTAVVAEGTIYDYAYLPQPMYFNQVQQTTSKVTPPQVLPKPPQTNYTQVVPKSLRIKSKEHMYANAFENQQ